MVDFMPLPLQIFWMGMPVWTWLMFIAIVLVILALDLGLFQHEAHKPSFRESALLTGIAMTLGASFSFVVYALYANGIGHSLDPEIANATPGAPRAWMAVELYLTGWIIEQTLAFDNVFVMAMIFSYFAIPPQYQHRVLFYGILGVIILRALMIGLGAALIHQFEWILYVFSAFLLFTGVKMFVMADDKMDIGANPALNWMRRHMRITPQLEGQSFFVWRPNGKSDRPVLWATPLLVALVLIEFADIIFAVDSVPAIFAITQDPFIVYTSNIFAILCLRSLYFVLASMVDRFHYLKYALALVLIYVGGKIFAQQFIGKIDPTLSLVITVGILAGGILLSLWKTRQERGQPEPGAGE